MTPACTQQAVTMLAEYHLCLAHFLERCYARLEQLDSNVRKRPLEPRDYLFLGALLEECSNRALAVSLQHDSLTNLDRSRLLDILLWAGDLHYLLRVPHAQLPARVPSRPHRMRYSSTRDSSRH